MIAHTLHAPTALLPTGWAPDVRIAIDSGGMIAAITQGPPVAGDTRVAGPLIPGMPNLHSHAFQRAMAGLTETRGPTADDFWSWRKRMYGFVERVTPESLGAIAALLYADMLRRGYTSVVEFHYLHYDRDGQAYAEPDLLSQTVIEAARGVGMAITHAPVLYTRGGFDDRPLGEAQRRFRGTPDLLLGFVERLRGRYAQDLTVRIGLALHSLRAVTGGELAAAVAALSRIDATAPVHIHIAEQTAEVEDCRSATGKSPVDLLFDLADVGPRWCLVHATHLTEGERRRLAASQAVAGLCLTTEANLGDGLFPALPYLAEGGVFGVGSDSHVTLDPAAELRLLEYGQRLTQRRRALLATPEHPSVGGTLFQQALKGGAQALGQPVGVIAPGYRADLVALDGDHALLAGKSGDAILDAWIFAGEGDLVRDVWVAGRQKIFEGRHPRYAELAQAYRRVLPGLLA